MDLTALAIFAGALAISAGSPGPSIAALVARVLTRGYSDVMPFLFAMWLGEAIWLACAVFGLVAIAQTFQGLFAVIKYAGIAYLLYLAWKMWTAPSTIEEHEIAPRTSPLRMFLAGFAVTIGNPKIMVFYVALLPVIIDLSQVTLLAWAELTATMLVVLVAVDLAWVLLASRARRFIRSPRAVRLTNRAGATVMAAAAAAMATSK
ncbi:LysE family translocator [Aliihoeflea sp. 40Bstr573]|uniref:LysE family translocator n=1 Tax=Aliihoeflea sp. 40Bstr573 TaxID=2696467 RepID=UPI0020952DDD|nr:LysE family translocator [Aliihoeflea sp. 40Bstr573]MCO6385891.1 LysE family transporter [Aliihoeflea sp. 40Bstr573]